MISPTNSPGKLFTLLLISFVMVPAFYNYSQKPDFTMPYQDAGLTEEEAAAHLLNRFAYGPRQGDIGHVTSIGLEQWFANQVNQDYKTPPLEEGISKLNSWHLSTAEIVQRYPRRGRIIRQAVEEGKIPENYAEMERREFRRLLEDYYKEKGYRPMNELLGELVAQKIFRATFSKNQLQEVLTDFWFNHFNVSVTDNQARIYLTTYERDAIRPNTMGDFEDLVLATAKHPAMLFYLDNVQSTASDSAPVTMSMNMRSRMGDRAANRMRNNSRNRRRGINENYARELMELHTLGVDGGYTQNDVEELARALTGWSIYPAGRPEAERIENNLNRAKRFGVEREGDFLFRADVHDAGEKTILGRTWPAGGGLEEGEEIIKMLANHPSTAHHISYKLAVRFVSDDPPDALVNRMAQTFLNTNGNIRSVLITLVESPEFWRPETVHSKIKTPFELVISAYRATDAKLDNPRSTFDWLSRMGQRPYAYQAPTGYPHTADAWVNAGALLNRMNFGLDLANNEIKGVQVDLLKLNQNREPESAGDALHTYAYLLLPERNLDQTLEALLPLVQDPNYAREVKSKLPPDTSASDMDDELYPDSDSFKLNIKNGSTAQSTSHMLAQVVGVIIGSPEFQRR